jgi:hypothetical protein
MLPEHPIDLRLWLAGAVDLGEMFWLAVEYMAAVLVVIKLSLSEGTVAVQEKESQ